MSSRRRSAFLAAILGLIVCACSGKTDAANDKAQGAAGERAIGAGAPSASQVDKPAPLLTEIEPKLQVGPWVPAPWSYEEPFINIVRASDAYWTVGDKNPQALIDAGHIDPDTGLPVSMPPGATKMESIVYFTTPDNSVFHGDWVLEWEGDADIEMNYIPFDLQWRENDTRLEFTRSNKTQWHSSILIRRLGPGGITALRLFRAENENALRAGKIFNPRFAEMISRNHIVRTMDLQEANRTGIRSLDDLATMTMAFWNNKAVNTTGSVIHKRTSMPLEAVVALAMEADVELWHHAPGTLGAPKAFNSPEIGGDIDSFVQMAEANADAILASHHWDDYADAFVAALEARGYPETRPLYTTIDNEVWNYAAQYHLSTRYAAGIGRGLTGADYAFREGYGAMMARWMTALEGAFQRAGRYQDVTYVVEGQAANGWTTTRALAQMKRSIEKSGGDWAAQAPKVGVSIASYWGGRCWYDLFPAQRPKTPWPFNDAEKQALRDRWEIEIKMDPQGLATRMADCAINGSEKLLATRAWVLRKFADHAREAATFKVKLIGAYEGGSHDIAPAFFSEQYGKNTARVQNFYRDYLWGLEGARVNAAVNDALIEAYPGIILSNYATVGQIGGQPWFDGLYGEDTAMQQSWRKYERRR